jgi:hypothetical protein
MVFAYFMNHNFQIQFWGEKCVNSVNKYTTLAWSTQEFSNAHQQQKYYLYDVINSTVVKLINHDHITLQRNINYFFLIFYQVHTMLKNVSNKSYRF